MTEPANIFSGLKVVDFASFIAGPGAHGRSLEKRDRVPRDGVGAAVLSRFPAGFAGFIKPPRRAA